MSYFTHHVFFCCNQRAEGETSCANHDAVAGLRAPNRRGQDLGPDLGALREKEAEA